MQPLRVGIVGIGNISGIYFKNLAAFDATTVVAVADIDRSRAEAAAEANGVPHVLTPDELVAHPEVDLVLNLTIPAAHGPVALSAVKNGKHVYNEKPLSVSLEQARELVAVAAEKGVRVGCAPDTFMGQGIQTAIATLNSGVIGDPIGATAAMRSRGPESWHPSPEFFFKPGGGPMLDMGPYYLTALAALFGPAKRTAGIVRASFPTRTVGSGPLKDSVITVETPTHLAGVIEYGNGAIAELVTSFDIFNGSKDSPITVYGTEGTMRVPDPNNFSGEVSVRKGWSEEWEVIEPTHAYGENSRGLGVLDIALAIRDGRPHRASGDLALHVLETMLSFEKGSTSGQHVTLSTAPERPAAVPVEGLS